MRDMVSTLNRSKRGGGERITKIQSVIGLIILIMRSIIVMKSLLISMFEYTCVSKPPSRYTSFQNMLSFRVFPSWLRYLYRDLTYFEPWVRVTSVKSHYDESQLKPTPGLPNLENMIYAKRAKLILTKRCSRNNTLPLRK